MASLGQTYTLYSDIPTGIAPGQSQYHAPTGGQVVVKETRNVGGQNYYNIQHIGGGTGWTPASALDSAIQAPQQAPQPQQQQQPQQQPQQQSYSAPSINTSRPPAPNLQQVYDDAVNNAGAKEAQAQADVYQGQIDSRRKALAETSAKISDDPYLSEATRTGRIAKLNDAANADITNFVNQQSVAQNKVSSAKADAQVRLNIASQQYNIQSQEYQQNLQLFNQLLGSGGLDNLNSDQLTQMATSTGLPSSVVQSLVDSSKKSKEVKPQLITVDDGVNQKVVAIDPATGKPISSSIIGASAKQIGGTSNPNNPGGGAFTSGQYSQALKIISFQDTANNKKDKGDHKLAPWEIQSAVSQLAAYLGGDVEKAKQLTLLAMNSGGYSEWTGQ